MHYAVVGHISAEVCNESENLGTEAYLRLYDGFRHSTAEMGMVELQAGYSELEMPLKGLHYLAREPLDADGGYQIGIDDRQHAYTGGPLLAVLELPFVGPIAGIAPPRNARFLLLRLLEPVWQTNGKAANWKWDHAIRATDWLKAKTCCEIDCLSQA